MQKLRGVMANETFEAIEMSKIPEGTRIFGYWFVVEMEKVGVQLKEKSRLVAQNYMDTEAEGITTREPTVKRFS